MPSKDLVLYAKWEVNSYTLTLNIAINGGTVEESVVKGAFKELGFTVSVAPATNGYTVEITVPYETNLSALNTIKFGENGEYSLSGTWTHDADGNVLLTFMPADNYEVSGTFTASAGDVTVTFYLVDGTEYYKTTVSKNTPVSEPPAPTRTGYTFDGWFTVPDGEEGEAFNFGTPITKETKLYAHWNAVEYEVTLRGEGVNLDPNPIKVAYGTTLTWSDGGLLPVPVRGGYTFEGWYLDADFSTTAEWTFMPAYDITLYAKWKATEYSIVFEWGLESEKTTITIDGGYNSALDLSSVGGAVPHYTFVWQVTADKKEPIEVTLDDFRTMPNLMAQYADYTSVVGGRVTITVQAAYTPIGYEITLEGADPVTVTVGDASEEKTEFRKLDDKTGYTFAGWYTQAYGGNIVDYLLNVHSDSVKLNLDARMCTVTMDDGSALKDSVAFGRAFRLAITMDGDYRLTGLEVTHGYNHEQPQYVHGNRQWQVDEIDANGRTIITIPASYVDGDLSISVKFENAPVGIDNVDKASPAIDVTVEQGTLVLRSQSEQPYRVISADGRIVAEGRLKGTKKISGLPVGTYTVNEVKCVVR